MLVQLVRHATRADELEGRIAATDPADLKTYDKLCRLALAESAHVNALCRSSRLTLQATTKSDVAAHRLNGARPVRDIEVLFGD